MPSSSARKATGWLIRAVTMATAMPFACRRFRPRPSCTWNTLASWPSSPYQRRPSVSVPSTSKAARRIFAARARRSAGKSARYMDWIAKVEGNGNARSDHACTEQIVNVERTNHAPLVVHHQQGVDLVLLHQLRSLGRQLVGADGLGAAGHQFGHAGAAQVHVHVVERAAQVAVGEHAE